MYIHVQAHCLQFKVCTLVVAISQRGSLGKGRVVFDWSKGPFLKLATLSGKVRKDPNWERTIYVYRRNCTDCDTLFLKAVFKLKVWDSHCCCKNESQ